MGFCRLTDDGSGMLPSACVQRGGFIPYSIAWHATTSVQLGRMDIAQKMMRHVLPYQGKGPYGGFFDGPKQAQSGNGVFCFDSSSAAIIACLWTGRLEEARRGGEYYLRLAALSDDTRWLWTLHSDGSAVWSKSDTAWKLNQAEPDPVTVQCTMDKVTLGQPHWKTGFYLAVCTYLYRTFSDKRYLDAAMRCAAFARETKDAKDGWMLWAHKLAWGASELYKETNDEHLLAMATSIGEMLIQRQNEAGYFPYTEWHPSNEPAALTYSICAQCTIWMSKVKEAISVSGSAYQDQPRC